MDSTDEAGGAIEDMYEPGGVGPGSTGSHSWGLTVTVTVTTGAQAGSLLVGAQTVFCSEHTLSGDDGTSERSDCKELEAEHGDSCN